MSQFYKILKADPLGEPWTPNAPDAKPIQNYWCQVEGEDLAVSIGKQVGNHLTPGESVYGDLMKATSQKGTQYWKFKSAKVPEGTTRPASTPAQAVAQQAVGTPVDMSATQPDWFKPWGNILIQLQKDMRLLKGDDLNEVAPIIEPPVVEAPSKVEQIGGDPIDEETQETLDAIFSPPETPEDK